MWKRLRIFLNIFFILFLSWKAEAQNLITTFVDPCTKATTTFVVPINGNTTIYFYGQSRQFTAADVSSGVFSTWVNQVYSDYRKISPCSVQQATVTRNQITSNIVSNVVSSVIGSIGTSMSSGMVTGSSSGGGGDDNASKGKTQSEKKKNKNENNNNNNNNSTSNSGGSGNVTTNTRNGGGGNVGNQNNNQSNTTSNGNNQTNNQQGTTNGQNNSQQNGGNGQGNTGNSGTVGSGGSGSNSSNQTGNGENQTKTQEKGEVVGTTVMNVDVRNDKGSDNSTSTGGGSKKSSSAKQSRNNPLIVSSDLTSAQNLDKSFTGIINIGMSQSSLLGTSSWGVTSMVWFNFKQFALNGRYTMMKMNKSGTIKFVHNINLTGAYSYGNVFGFLGYSVIVNAGKWGITGGNLSGAITKTPEDKNLFISPSITAFYTKPFMVNKKLTISPEIYLISTPVVYSSVDKITVTDRYFSGFLGSGFDYQISRRFKFNVNYKANLSTNPEFPILSFFLVGSKINL